jgi:hypothetical protein
MVLPYAKIPVERKGRLASLPAFQGILQIPFKKAGAAYGFSNFPVKIFQIPDRFLLILQVNGKQPWLATVHITGYPGH